MGDMTLPPRGCIRAGANWKLVAKQKFGGYLLAIPVNLDNRFAPNAPTDGSTLRAAAGLGG